jgi:hypothetical protein
MVPYPGGISDEELRYPNALRFSGFNINDVGITGSCIVTNLFVTIEYSDDSLKYGYSTIQEGKANGSYIVINGTKVGNIALSPKRFALVSSASRITRTIRIPCMKDQNWSTNTFGSGILTNTNFKGQSEKGGESGDGVDEYFESPYLINTLTVAEINDSNFYLDLLYARPVITVGGTLKIHSIAVSVEYIKPYAIDTTLYCKGTEVNFPYSVRSISWGSTTAPWSFPERVGGSPNCLPEDNSSQLFGNNDSYIDVFRDPYPINNTGNVNDQLKRFDTQLLLGKLPAVSDINDAASSLTDMILDIRVNGVPLYLSGTPPKVKWVYILQNGVDAITASSTGETIYSHFLQTWEPGIRQSPSSSGQDWRYYTGGMNTYEKEYYGSEDNWYMKHFPIKRNNSNYSIEGTNTVTYPGLVYDPLWIEKALKIGNLYFGINLTVDPGTAIYWNTIPHPTFWIRVDSMSVRIKYNQSVTPPTIIDSSLLYRFTP